MEIFYDDISLSLSLVYVDDYIGIFIFIYCRAFGVKRMSFFWQVFCYKLIIIQIHSFKIAHTICKIYILISRRI